MFLSNMYLPAENLQKWIKVFWVVAGNGNGLIHQSQLMPDGCATLVFILNGTLDLPYYQNASMRYGAYIIPPNTEHHFNLISDDIFHIDIQLNPGVFYQLFKIPVSKLENRIYNLSELSISFDSAILEKLFIHKNETELLLHYLNSYIYTLFSKNNFYEDSLLKGITQLYKDGDVDTFLSRQNLSVRQLQRNVKNLTGLSPKAISRISRFYGVLNHITNMPIESKFSYSDLDDHFSDQSHFIKEFKSFTGITPNNFLFHSDDYLQFSGLCAYHTNYSCKSA